MFSTSFTFMQWTDEVEHLLPVFQKSSLGDPKLITTLNPHINNIMQTL